MTTQSKPPFLMLQLDEQQWDSYLVLHHTYHPKNCCFGALSALSSFA